MPPSEYVLGTTITKADARAHFSDWQNATREVQNDLVEIEKQARVDGATLARIVRRLIDAQESLAAAVLLS